MLVQTVLGQLTVADPPAGTEAYWAEAVALCARDMTSMIGKLPDELRPAGRVLARSWAGDRANYDAVRALETGDLAAIAGWTRQLPDVAETNAQKLAAVHMQGGDEARGAVARMLKIADLLKTGRTDEAAARLAQARARRGIDAGGAPLASLGAWRAHTGMELSTIDWNNDAQNVVEVA